MKIENYTFSYNVEVRFVLSGALWRILMDFSNNHYDPKCFHAGDVEGFIFKWGNKLIFETLIYEADVARLRRLTSELNRVKIGRLSNT